MENINKSESNGIKVLQNACLRILTYCICNPTLPVYKANNSIGFVEIIRLGLILFMYMYNKGLLPVSVIFILTAPKQIKHMKYSCSHPEKVCLTVIQ